MHLKGEMMQNLPRDQSIQAILFRVDGVEKEIKDVQEKLKTYVPAKENDLQLQNIQNIVSRVERDVIDIKTRVEVIKDKMETQDKELRARDEKTKEEQSKSQIRGLLFIVSSIITVGAGIVIAIFTHFLGK